MRRRRLLMLVSGVTVVVLVTVSLLIAFNRDTDKQPELLSRDDATAVYLGLQSSGTTLGNPDAPVTIVEYADYQCPHCANFALNTEPQLIQDFVATGKVKYEFQPMPIISKLPLDSPSNESVLAAEASMCAIDQGQFWEFHHLLFSKQTGENIGTFSSPNLITYASEAGLDVTAFTDCLNSGKYKQTVLDSRSKGIEDGVAGTPTFFINGTQVVLTNQGYDRLKTQIQAAVDGEDIP